MQPKRNNNLSVFIGLWLGLTVVAGGGVFALLYWATSNSRATPEPSPAISAATAAPKPLPSPTAAPAATEVEGPAVAPACNYGPLPASGFGYGIQVHALIPGIDAKPWMNIVRSKLGLPWVKLQVRWYFMEPQPGQIDWSTLDNAMEAACGEGLRVMLSVIAAPEWTRANPLSKDVGEAPPDDPQVYATFVGQILDRYPGKIQAIEVWNEANLEREWNTASGVSAAEFARLLQAAHTAVKQRDPSIIVISGAPAPTGVNCAGSWPDCAGGRPVVVDDAAYLKQLIAAGGLNYADCVGTHSNGTNLPPTADGANPPPDTGYSFKGPWSSPHYSWALKSQVETYAKILQDAGLNLPQCLTEFGYASPVDGVVTPGYEFAADVSEKLQAEYLVAAYNWMRDSGLVQMAFLFNLDYGPKGGDPATDDNVMFSLLTRGGVPRPAFDAIGAMPKP